MNYKQSILFLYNLQKFGVKFGLRGIRKLLKSFDNPERKFLSVHIAGTNGKGSTASMVASIFTAAGYKTGLYTSPHLVHFNERIRIDGKPIPSKRVKELINELKQEIEKNNSTFFEAVTAIAFKYFAESKVDIAVIETGLGGRLDATNVLKPLISIITTINLEHTQILGNKIEEIASEKGGIIKLGVPCVSGVQSPKAEKVLRHICREKKSKFILVTPNDFIIKKSTLDGLVIDFYTMKCVMKNVYVSLAGDYQAINALLAINAVEIVSKRSGLCIDQSAIRKGLGRVQKYSGLYARLSIVREHPLIIADVAHNPAAINKMCKFLRGSSKGKFNIMIGLMKDKNYRRIILEIKEITESAYVVQARTERSRNVDDLYQEFQRQGVKVKKYSNVTEGLINALKEAETTPLLITGSHFVVGEALAYMMKEKYLTINQ